MRKRTMRTGLSIVGVLVVVAVSGAVIGSTTNVPVIEVTRETTATREQVWELWADVPNRTRWDADLEYARLDGPFQTGSTGGPKPPRHDPGDGFFMRHLVAPLLKAVLRKRYADLALMEDVVRESGLDWTIVRAPQLIGRPLGGTYRTAYGQNVRRGLRISLLDYYEVCGNEDLRKFSQFVLSTASRTSAGTTNPTLYKSATVSISNGLSSRPKPPARSDPIPRWFQPLRLAI